ncbi:endolytic transglycosylase MltG [Alkalibacillus haloalkaliphilus]|uniref:Endolytic transglycosylase MltG n=1 Tax=Alkalibacillus haloalkaliphilus TaxID=94136 RepID=A0A511W617_9BACI|nr:endolytic transglycosylase MltG [Alkalibacillus haloalkaliphilus]GEN46540.1 hypothetical protein AHA02nite_23160 [Alkalibacillus haloalkaliphilus]
MAFSLGVIVTTLIITVVYFNEAEGEQEVANVEANEHVSIEEAHELLEEEGHIIMSQSDMDQFEQLEEDYKDLKEQLDDYEAQEQLTDDQSDHKIYTLEIESGMSTHNIASVLEEESIIDDSDELVNYLTENEYSRAIQVGTYVVTSEMSHQQIAITITN